MLGTNDSRLGGHLYDAFQKLPEGFDAHIVTMEGWYGKSDYCFYDSHSLMYKIQRRVYDYYVKFRILCRLFVIPRVDQEHLSYCYFSNELISISAKKILNKCPKNWIPEYILIYWSANFLNSKTVKKLYDLTGAKIVYFFIDEAPMTGGCHFPVDCKEYLNKCENCVALKHGKKYSEYQLRQKKRNLKNIPKIIVGTPYDLKLAKKTELFADAEEYPMIINPSVQEINKDEIRKKLKFDYNRFYILIGANRVTDVRKGVKYALDGIIKCAKGRKNITLLMVGYNDLVMSNLNIENVEIKELGFLSLDDLLNYLSASDCFISTPLADSGPVMVNYSIALGTPVISFPIGIAETLVIHKKTGYIATYKNSDDICDGINYLASLTDNEKERMNANCKKQMEDALSNGSFYDFLLRKKK